MYGRNFKDVALRIVASISRKVLCRTSHIHSNAREIESRSLAQFTLESGKSFEMQVLFVNQTAFIAVNGMHVAKYVHCTVRNQINSIEIRGDVTNMNVHNKYCRRYPIIYGNRPHISRLRGLYAVTAKDEHLEPPCTEEQAFLAVPYYAVFGAGFFANRYTLTVSGYVSPTPSTIRVALQVCEDVWPEPEIPVQVEVRFSEEAHVFREPLVLINSFLHGVWSGEINCNHRSELRPGSEYILRFERGRGAFQIYINNRHVFNYPYRKSPNIVGTCMVEGTIQLHDVVIESDYMSV